jgi:diguanylate cyclase (GGDEF)-like protein
MLLSIRKIFINIKISLFVLGLGTTLLTLQMFHIANSTERLNRYKLQNELITKAIETKISDPQMAKILINGTLAELKLALKLSAQESLFDPLSPSHEQYLAYMDALGISAETFHNYAVSWSDAIATPHEKERYKAMIESQKTYRDDLDRISDYEINLIHTSAYVAKTVALALFGIGLGVFLLYRYRLTQIYQDIDIACALDTGGEPKTILTNEIDFILKRLSRKSTQSAGYASFTHPISGMNNQKGVVSAFNAKKASRGSNHVFMALFEIDHSNELSTSLNPADLRSLLKKVGEIIGLYEQPLDVSGHLDNNQFVLLMSRSNKQSALEDCEKIVHTIEAAGFSTAKGIIRITASAGFILKIPVKSLEDVMEDANKLVQQAKEKGGNRVVELHVRA